LAKQLYWRARYLAHEWHHVSIPGQFANGADIVEHQKLLTDIGYWFDRLRIVSPGRVTAHRCTLPQPRRPQREPCAKGRDAHKKKLAIKQQCRCAIARVVLGRVRTDGWILEIGTISRYITPAVLNQSVKKKWAYHRPNAQLDFRVLLARLTRCFRSLAPPWWGTEEALATDISRHSPRWWRDFLWLRFNL
jgi:hypothetical protein